jgi:hypothetical protein
MSSTSDQPPQPPQQLRPLTDAEVAELINEAMKAQSVLNQVCGGVGRLGETVTDAARYGCEMFTRAYAQIFHGPTTPFNAEGRNVIMNEAFDVEGVLTGNNH